MQRKSLWIIFLTFGLIFASTTRIAFTRSQPLDPLLNVPLGLPGTVFRYVETIGETGVPYLADSDHLYDPVGVGLDNSGNLWVAEGVGSRVLKYRGDGTFLLSVGSPGISNIADETNFGSPTDIAADIAGNIWVVDRNAHRVVKLDAAGKYLMQLGVTWEPGSDNSHFDSPVGVALDSSGSIYVSDTNNNRIQVFNSSGVYTKTIGSPGSGDGQFNYPTWLTFDDNDFLYVTDTSNHRVQIFDASHTYVVSLGVSASPGSDHSHFNEPRGVAVDSTFIYVVDNLNHRVEIFDRAAPYAYRDTLGGFGSGSSQFKYPRDIAVDPAGFLYVADTVNYRVQKYDLSTKMPVRTFGTTGVPYLTDASHFNQPNKIAIDPSGNMGVLEDEGRGHRFIKIDPNGVPLFTIGEAGVNGSDNAHFSDARGVAFDSSGKIYIGDCANHRVQIFSSSGAYLATLGSSGSGDYQFSCPTGVAFDSQGNFYVADSGNQRIQIFDSTLAYSATLGTTGVPGSSNGNFRLPQDVAVDSEGSIYVADTFNERVQKFDSGLQWKLTLGVAGECGADFDHFCIPGGIAVDANDNLYVAEYWNPRVQVFDSNGAYLTTIGGNWGNLSSQFYHLKGVAVDSAGNVYIPDLLNHRIQKFAPGVPGWEQVNVNGFGERFAQGVPSLEVFNGQLYAGTSTNWQIQQGPQVFRSADGATWSAASQPGFNSTYATTNSTILDLAVFKGSLYAGVGWGGIHQGQIWRSADGTAWEEVTTNGFGDGGNRDITIFTEFDGLLYAGVFNQDSGAQIWRSATGNPGDWTKVAPDQTGTQNVAAVTGFAVFKGDLYAAVESAAPYTYPAQVWRSSDGSAWQTVGGNGFGEPANSSTGGFAQYGGHLYLGTRNYDTGAQVWRSADGITWTKAVGDGFGDIKNFKIESLVVFAGQLYAVVNNEETGLQVWRSSNGLAWEPVRQDGFGDSNTFATFWNNATLIYDHQLYYGTWNTANGGELWRYEIPERAVYLPLIR